MRTPWHALALSLAVGGSIGLMSYLIRVERSERPLNEPVPAVHVFMTDNGCRCVVDE